jgi:lipoprotein signal peptidase
MRVIALAAAVAAVDLATKRLADPYLNPSMSLGSITVTPVLMVLVMIAAMLVCLVLMTYTEAPTWARGLFIGGCIGNITDRLVYGAVRDWIIVDPIVLNIADIAVMASLVGWFISVQRRGVIT